MLSIITPLLVLLRAPISDAIPFLNTLPSSSKKTLPSYISIRGGGQSTISKVDTQIDVEERKSNMINNTTITKGDNELLNFIFSDVDGTLVHYPQRIIHTQNDGILQLPPSSTGMRGIISSKTLELCQKLRNDYNTKLVLVSGMRTTTLLKRLPYLPKADAYASEAGGRIFFPVTDINRYNGTVIYPVQFIGASDADLEPFGLIEDMDWRRNMSTEIAAGTDGYIDDVMNIFLKRDNKNELTKPISDREGALWRFARKLEEEGFVLDYNGYTCCFRVNLKQQMKDKISDVDFELLSSRNVTDLGLATSVNLGCIDFYPINSGKKNCCSYLAKKFATDYGGNNVNLTGEELLLHHALCFCDDDNDLEMALACGKVFVPSVSSPSMAKTAYLNKEKIFITENKEEKVVEVVATEVAVLKAIEILENRSSITNKNQSTVH